MQRALTPFILLCLVGFSRALGAPDRSAPCPALPAELGAEALAHRADRRRFHHDGVFIKFPAGALSDPGPARMLLLGAASLPSLLSTSSSKPTRCLASASSMGSPGIFSPVASAAVADLFHESRGEKLGGLARRMSSGAPLAPCSAGSRWGRWPDQASRSSTSHT